MQINIIDAKPQERKKIRVCAYCRVSTDADEQENSLENQIRHYEQSIKANPDYEYVGVYSDFALSGFKEQRPGFQTMLADARKGKIDFILTKSVSRFARNTGIVLEATRELRELHVGVFFELQNINTLSCEGELLLTILAAFAQAESEGGSVGAKMVYQRKYEKGIAVRYLERSFGYTKNTKGEFVPEPEEARWVKKIYQMASEGYTIAAIKRYLNAAGIKTVTGAKWRDSSVLRLVENEIYKGDYIMHKHFVNEERKLVKNRGEVDAWYITGDHKRIVSGELWQKAQEALNQRREYLTHGSEVPEETPSYQNHIYCSNCGFPLYKKVYSNGNRICFSCSGQKRYGMNFCNGVNVPELILRSWDINEDVYVREATTEKGIKEYSYVSWNTWRRRHKKKKFLSELPKATEENYPYLKKIYCAACGSKLTRYVAKGEKVLWICSGYKQKGKEFCEGVRVPDEVIKDWGEISSAIFIERKGKRNGEKCYHYSSKKPD